MRGGLALAVALPAVLAVACVSAIPRPTTEDARVASARFGAVTVADLEAGRSAYVARCSGCHNLYEPSYYPPEKWPAEVAEMGARGEVPKDDLAKIEHYLVTMASRAER